MQLGSPQAVIIKQKDGISLYNDGTYTVNSKLRKSFHDNPILFDTKTDYPFTRYYVSREVVLNSKKTNT